MLSAEPTSPFFRTDPAEPAPARLPIAERMAIVMRRHGGLEGSTTRRDFLRAPETHELTEAELDAHIGEAAQLVENPPDPLDAFDRERRIERAAVLVLGAFPDEQDIFQVLRSNGFTPIEIGALWPKLMARAAKTVRTLKQPVLA